MEVKDYFENYGEGWISLYRSLKKHWLWQDKPFTKGQAWIDMLMQCNHADNKVNIGNAVILCKRGESLNSLDTWAKDWGWHKSRVKRFLELLKNDSMIDLKSTHNTTHLIILNYDTYQKHRNANRTPIERKQNEAETKPTLNNKDNNVNNEKKRDSGDKKKSPSPADVVKNFFEMHYNENKRDETYLKYENRFPDIEECRKFCDYWTELTKSGKVMRWEKQSVFELGKRIGYWISRLKDFKKTDNGQYWNMSTIPKHGEKTQKGDEVDWVDKYNTFVYMKSGAIFQWADGIQKYIYRSG